MLSPAYDLINTRIHVDDADFALSGGLFKDNFESKDDSNTLSLGARIHFRLTGENYSCNSYNISQVHQLYRYHNE